MAAQIKYWRRLCESGFGPLPPPLTSGFTLIIVPAKRGGYHNIQSMWLHSLEKKTSVLCSASSESRSVKLLWYGTKRGSQKRSAGMCFYWAGAYLIAGCWSRVRRAGRVALTCNLGSSLPGRSLPPRPSIHRSPSAPGSSVDSHHARRVSFRDFNSPLWFLRFLFSPFRICWND